MSDYDKAMSTFKRMDKDTEEAIANPPPTPQWDVLFAHAEEEAQKKSLNEFINKLLKPIDQEEAKDYAEFLGKKFNKWEKAIFSFLDKTIGNEAEKSYTVVNKTFGEFLRRLFDAVNTVGFRKGLTAVISASLKEGVAEAEKELNHDIGIGTAFKQEVNRQATRQLEGFTIEGKKWKGLKGVSEDVRHDIEDIVSNGITEKKGLQVIKEEIKESMTKLKGGSRVDGAVTEGRVMKIARTESNRFINQGKLAAFKDSGLKGKKYWNAFLDNRTSDVCKRLEQLPPIHLDANFVDKDGEWDTPPAHPNCRSRLQFKLDADDN